MHSVIKQHKTYYNYLNPHRYTFEVAPVFVLIEQHLIQMLCGLYGWPGGDGIFSPGKYLLAKKLSIVLKLILLNKLYI